MAPRGEARELNISKAQSYMDKDGNLKSRSPDGDDFGKGFRKWANTIESNELNENNPNSFLSRGGILSYLEKKKHAEQKDQDKKGRRHTYTNTGDSPSHGGRQHHSNIPRRTQSTGDGSTTTSHGTDAGHHRNKSIDQFSLTDAMQHAHIEEQQQPHVPRKMKGHMTRRPPPNKYEKRVYRLGMQPHHEADGIMTKL